MLSFQLVNPYHLRDELNIFLLQQIFIFSLRVFDYEADRADSGVVKRMGKSDLDRLVFRLGSDAFQADDEVQEAFVGADLVSEELALIGVFFDGFVGMVDESLNGLFDLGTFDERDLRRDQVLSLVAVFFVDGRSRGGGGV